MHRVFPALVYAGEPFGIEGARRESVGEPRGSGKSEGSKRAGVVLAQVIATAVANATAPLKMDVVQKGLRPVASMATVSAA
eukprot:2699086-Lingulodinium_polyedra.AAC.1